MKVFALMCAVGLLASLGAAPVQAQDGTIVAWGADGSGQCIVPSPNVGFVAVAGGGYHSLGLRADSTIAAWGHNDSGECDIPAPNAAFVAVSGGYDHSLGLKPNGSIVAWGSNEWGQCNVPAPNTGFVAIAAGGYHSLGLKASGVIVAWGQGDYCQICVPGPNTDFVAVAAGGWHSLGLKSDGTIVAWGESSTGECTVPAPNADFVAIGGGADHSIGLKSDGTIRVWGSNVFGQCNMPLPNSNFVAVAAGGYHSLGLKADSSIVAWGYNGHGQCTIPEPNSGFGAVVGGYHHSLGLRPHPSSNGSGMLVVHDTGIAYTSDLSVPPSSPEPSCAGVVNQIPLQTKRVWKVYAVFPSDACPRLKALSWGLYPSNNGDGGVVILGGGLPDPQHDSQVTQAGWPDTWGCGIYENFQTTKTARVVECYWFGGYAYAGTGGETQLEATGVHPTMGGVFFDDAVPPHEWPIAGFGSIGFGQAGSTPCPTGDPSGACCDSPGLCTLVPAASCPQTSIWQGAGTLCSPNPCPDLTGVDDGNPDAARLQLSIAPNPSAAGVVIRCLLPQPGLTTLELFDASGRMVRRLHRGVLPAGETPISWDGRDDTRRQVGSGVYLVKVTTPAGETTGRVVLTP